MSAFPDVVTHTFNPGPGPFLNLCALEDTAAELILDEMRRDYGRCVGGSYLARRRATEDWLIRERRRKGVSGSLARPIYFFLGNYDDGLDAARPAACVVPLSLLPPETLSFTLRDSMECFDAIRFRSGDAPYASLYTYREMKRIYTAGGQILPERRDAPGPPAGSTLAPVRRGFVEVQVWCDAPLHPYRERLRRPALGG